MKCFVNKKDLKVTRPVVQYTNSTMHVLYLLKTVLNVWFYSAINHNILHNNQIMCVVTGCELIIYVRCLHNQQFLHDHLLPESHLHLL